MTQEQKELLINDLCARLPYGVWIERKLKSCKFGAKCMLNAHDISAIEREQCEFCKPYLFPLSSMTDELWDKEFMGCGITEFTRDSFKYGCETLEFNNSNPNLSSMVRFINKLIKNHFDIYGLIPMGLALDATNLNIY